jgi:hypothetical protein
MSFVPNVLALLNRPILNFTNYYELYYVTLPFMQHRIPNWVFQISLYLPLAAYLSRTRLNISFDAALDTPQTEDESHEFMSKYADLLDE